MDIKILKNFENYEKYSNTMIRDNLVLERIELPKNDAGMGRVKYILFDVSNNSKKEIMPQVDKYDLGTIKNVSENSEYVYFFKCNHIKDSTSQITLMRYNHTNEDREEIFTFEDDMTLYSVAKRLHVFILNDNYLFIQHEYMKTNRSENCQGFFEFQSFLYNYKDQQFYSVVDENLSANGISDMIPLSDGNCLIKTGYDLLTDDRYNYLEKDEVTVENISIVNISQLVSDILIMQTNILMNSIETAYYDVTIPSVEVKGKYIIYSKLNNKTHEEEVIFYDTESKEITNCINKNVISIENMAKRFIIGEEPYICVIKKEAIEFVNLKKAKIEFKFDASLDLLSVVNDMFVFSGVSKKFILKSEHSFFQVYGYPQKNLILKEKGECFEVRSYEDTLYLFVKNGD